MKSVLAWRERRWPRVGLALAAGLFICASLPPWGWWPLAFLGIALWAVLLDGRSRGQRFWVGAAVGLAWFLPSTLWMIAFTPPGWLAGVSVWYPLVCGLTSLACPPRRAALALPGALVISEWVRWHAPFGGVPLSSLAVTQGRGPLLWVAPLFGTLGVAAAAAFLGGALATAAVRSHPKAMRSAAAAVAVVVVVGVAGVADSWEGADGRSLRVAVVQGGGEQQTVAARTDYSVVLGRHISAARAIDDTVDLVVMPENIVNVADRFAGSPEEQQLIDLARDLNATVVAGIVEGENSPTTFRNAAIAIEPDGRVVGRYDKVRRVPFGEYTPMRGLMTGLAEATGSFVPPRDAIAGSGPPILTTTAGDLGVAISWEVFFPRRILEANRLDAELLLNPTNGSSYWLTQVQSQQINQSALRAAESGKWLLQAAPTGFSAIIDEHGSVVQRTGLREQRVLVATVQLAKHSTRYTWWGEVPAWAFAIATLAAAWFLQRRDTPDQESTAETGGRDETVGKNSL